MKRIIFSALLSGLFFASSAIHAAADSCMSIYASLLAAQAQL